MKWQTKSILSEKDFEQPKVDKGARHTLREDAYKLKATMSY